MPSPTPAEVLQASLLQHFRYHGDVYVGAQVPVVIDEDVTLTPLLVVAIGTIPDERERWSIPDEGTPELVIIDVAQAGDKPHYEKVGVRELFIVDMTKQSVKGYWLSPGGLVDTTPEESGRVGSDELRLELGFKVVDDVPTLRFFQRNGTLLETPEETETARRNRINKLIATHTDELEEQIADHEATIKR